MGFLFPSVLNSLWWRRHRTKLASPPCGERVVVCLFIWCSLFVVLLRVVVVACYVDHAVLALPSGRGWDELKESLKTSWIFLEMNNNNSWQKWKWSERQNNVGTMGMKPMAMRNRTYWMDRRGYWCCHCSKGYSKVHPIALNGIPNESWKGKVFLGSEEKSGILCFQAAFWTWNWTLCFIRRRWCSQ